MTHILESLERTLLELKDVPQPNHVPLNVSSTLNLATQILQKAKIRLRNKVFVTEEDSLRGSSQQVETRFLEGCT